VTLLTRSFRLKDRNHHEYDEIEASKQNNYLLLLNKKHVKRRERRTKKEKKKEGKKAKREIEQAYSSLSLSNDTVESSCSFNATNESFSCRNLASMKSK
jgi:hypothetical protein